MINRTLPYFLEDRTGQYICSDLDDVYDRLFLHVGPAPSSTSSSPSSSNSSLDTCMTLMIYNTGRRSSSQRDYRPSHREPSVILEFGPGGTLGQIIFSASSFSLPMGQYLRKTSMFGGSLSRRFRGSDGEEYRWSYKTVPDQEWTCTDSREYIVAHYTLRKPGKPVYGTSGNILTINEAYAGLSAEILASLTIMRHIAAHKL